MCVIAIVEDCVRPNQREVEAMYEQNSHGAGVAWRHEGRVHWMKGLSLADILELNATLPLPYVMHFRIPSCGGEDKRLNHPFVIDSEAGTDLTGSTDGYVLFHNGHWSSYDREMKDALYRSRLKAPVGPWSDTRVMAFLAGNFGLGILDFIDEKLVAFGPDDIKVYGKESDWSYHDGQFLVSNKFWDWRLRTTLSDRVKENEEWVKEFKRKADEEARERRIFLGQIDTDDPDDSPSSCKALLPVKKSTSLVAGGTPLDELTFRGDHRPEGEEGNQQESIQEAGEAPQQETGQGVEGVAQEGTGRARRTDSDGRSHTASGGHAEPSQTQLDEVGRRRMDEWKWARRVCDVMNPRSGQAPDPRIILSAEEGERERRSAAAANKGIIHLGRM